MVALCCPSLQTLPLSGTLSLRRKGHSPGGRGKLAFPRGYLGPVRPSSHVSAIQRSLQSLWSIRATGFLQHCFTSHTTKLQDVQF